MVIILGFCVAIVSHQDVRDVFCLCTARHDAVPKILNLLLRGLMVLSEIAFIVYSNYQLARHRVNTKYGIKCELLTVSIVWIVQRVSIIFGIGFYEC